MFLVHQCGHCLSHVQVRHARVLHEEGVRRVNGVRVGGDLTVREDDFAIRCDGLGCVGDVFDALQEHVALSVEGRFGFHFWLRLSIIRLLMSDHCSTTIGKVFSCAKWTSSRLPSDPSTPSNTSPMKNSNSDSRILSRSHRSRTCLTIPSDCGMAFGSATPFVT